VDVNPCGGRIVITAVAKNPGGVKELKLTVEQEFRQLYSVQTSATPDSNNRVPDLLSIPGTDGSGGVGSNPIIVTIGSTNSSAPPAELKATAVNFNSQTSSIHVFYNCPYLPAPSVTPSILLRARPNPNNNSNDAWIPVGSTATLHWEVSNCSGAASCSISLQGYDGPGYQHLILSATGVSPVGDLQVVPRFDSRYTLAVRYSGGTTSQSVQVRHYGTAPQNPQLSRFCFRMENPQSTVTPCFSLEIYATDAATAKRTAEQLNGSFTAQQIDCSTVTQACP